MGKAKASADLRIGVGALGWASLSAADASAALSAATGCSPSELLALLQGDQSLIPQVARVLCADEDAFLTAWSSGELDASFTRAALRAELSKLVPATKEGGDNGDV